MLFCPNNNNNWYWTLSERALLIAGELNLTWHQVVQGRTFEEASESQSQLSIQNENRYMINKLRKKRLIINS